MLLRETNQQEIIYTVFSFSWIQQFKSEIYLICTKKSCSSFPVKHRLKLYFYV